MEEVFVTGSRIPRADLTGSSPISVIEADDFRALNTVNVEEYLRRMPQFSAALGKNANNGNPGVATLDLRDLGEERTLVLMDGKRLPTYEDDGLVDINMIPASLIERVEVVTGGASAVYGADAVAGVVNFIMKRDFEGVEFDGSYSIFEEGDGEVYDLSVTLGGNFDSGRGNIVLNVAYTNQDKVNQDARPFGVTTLDDLLDEVGSATTPQGSISYTTYPGDPDGGFAQFDQNGDIVPFADTFNFNPFNLYQVPVKKWTATTIARYDVSDDIEFFGRASFSNNRQDTIVAPSGTFFESFNIDYVNNPFLGPGARARFALVDAAEINSPNDGTVDVLFGRRQVELGTRDSLYETTTYQVVGGFEGELNWGGGVSWEAFGQFGRTTRTQNFRNDIVLSKTQQAMNAVVDPLTGNIVCADPSGGCLPVNYFGLGNFERDTPDADDFLRTDLNENNRTSQTVFGASLAGDFEFALPSADNPIGYAVGVEFRREEGQSLPDENYVSGNAIGFGASSKVDAQYEVMEFFAEALVPLVEGVSGAQLLAVEAGVRLGEYENRVGNASKNFDNTSYKLMAEWMPFEGLRFRGGLQGAVRAPNLEEVGLPRTPGSGDLTNDPCEGTNPLGNQALIDLCTATGVPAAAIGSVVSIIAGQINNFLGGDPLLEPEKSDTFTAGFVWTPDAAPNLELSLDYYSIDVEDAITQISEQNIVDACYNIEQDPNSKFCRRIFRNTINGGLSGPKSAGVDVSRVNAGFLKVEGLDFVAAYRDLELDGGWGALSFTLQSNYLISQEQQDANFLPAFECAGLVGTTCLAPAPELTFYQTTHWSRGSLNLSLVWSYIDEVTQEAIVLSGTPASNYALPSLDAQHYFDLLGSYDLSDTWTLRFGITNLLDNDPPVPGNDYGGTTENSGNTYPATYEPLGRRWFFGASSRF